MAKKSVVGSWAFLIGVVLALIMGAISAITEFVTILLVIIGLVVGFLNITEKEVKPFLWAATVLVVVSWFGSDVMAAVPLIGRMLNALLILFVPATVIVALRSVFGLAKD